MSPACITHNIIKVTIAVSMPENNSLRIPDKMSINSTPVGSKRKATIAVTPSPSTGTVALICLAMTPNHKEVTLWSQSGRLSSDMASHAMELCRDGCRTMHKFMRESWISSLSSSNDDDDDMDSSNSNKMKQ